MSNNYVLIHAELTENECAACIRFRETTPACILGQTSQSLIIWTLDRLPLVFILGQPFTNDCIIYCSDSARPTPCLCAGSALLSDCILYTALARPTPACILVQPSLGTWAGEALHLAVLTDSPDATSTPPGRS